MNAIRRMLPLLGTLVIMGAAVPAMAHIEHKQDSEAPTQGVVNINTATAEQLALLPGVGPSRAEAIIQARERRPFRAIQELIRVRGIGRATLDRLRPYIAVSGETTLTQPIRMPRSE
jgi:competence protein ComEA